MVRLHVCDVVEVVIPPDWNVVINAGLNGIHAKITKHSTYVNERGVIEDYYDIQPRDNYKTVAEWAQCDVFVQNDESPMFPQVDGKLLKTVFTCRFCKNTWQ